MSRNEIKFMGPDEWDDLCTKHAQVAASRLDYRIAADQADVVEAFKKARYYDKYVAEYAAKIHDATFSLVLTNNRTPIEIDVPFSPDMTVKNYLDMGKQLLGLSLDWTNFPDLERRLGPLFRSLLTDTRSLSRRKSTNCLSSLATSCNCGSCSSGRMNNERENLRTGTSRMSCISVVPSFTIRLCRGMKISTVHFLIGQPCLPRNAVRPHWTVKRC